MVAVKELPPFTSTLIKASGRELDISTQHTYQEDGTALFPDSQLVFQFPCCFCCSSYAFVSIIALECSIVHVRQVPAEILRPHHILF